MKTLRHLTMFFALMFLVVPLYRSQSTTPPPTSEIKQADDNEIELKKMALLADLQSLAAEAAELKQPLALSLAKAEIADAAWSLDPVWSKQLVREAYELTLPSEEELAKRRDKPDGTSAQPAGSEQSRDTVRARVLQVAASDPSLAKELSRLGAQKLEQQQAQMSYAALAGQALQKGDTETAGKYIRQSIRVDPTQMDSGFSIMQLAAQDRVAADKLIVEYIEMLRAVPLSTQTAARTYVMLSHLVFPASAPPVAGTPQRISPPGPSVMKAYVGYMIESLDRLEQSESGSLRRFRPMLVNVWPILRQHAPEMTDAFLKVEMLSRRPGEDATLPKGNIETLYKDRYEKRVKDALDSDKPDSLSIHSAISRGDFAQARRMIDKLDNGAQKAQLVESVNTAEAISLATKGDLTKAGQLAQQLNTAVSIMRAYPVIVNQCVTKKDRTCAANTIYHALKQLKDAANVSPTPPEGVPTSLMPTSQEFDPVALSLCKLAKAVAPLDGALALNVLDEVVQAANRSDVDTTQGHTGLEMDVFKKLAVVDETRVYQAVSGLKQRLPRVVALAVLAQWRAQQLVNSLKAEAPRGQLQGRRSINTRPPNDSSRITARRLFCLTYLN
jgi:hypothetical protein